MSEEEIWKPVVGYEGCYEVSNLGRVRSLDREVRGESNSVCLRKGRILKPGATWGYLYVTLCSEGKVKHCRVHRLVLAAFRGESELDVNHINHVKADNRLENLEYVTVKENISHMVKANRQACGEKIGIAKLDEEAIQRMRELYSEGWLTYEDLSIIFKVAESTVSQIINRKTWKHVKHFPR